MTTSLVASALVAAACSSDATKSGSAKGGASADSAKTAAAKPTTYIGTRYDPLPAGVSYEGGAVLLGKDGRPSAFALTHVLTPRGNTMWLDSIVAATGPGRARIVRAELVVPPVHADERLFIGSCDVDGKLDGAVVAIARHQRNEVKHKVIRQAWRADAATGSFIMLPIAGIVCEDPGS